MRGFGDALWAEILKVRRSRIFPVTLAVTAFMILMVGFMIFILKDPTTAQKYGLIAKKARITAGEASWTSYHMMLVQVDSILGLLGFGFVTSWIFGREYSDRTVKDLLALPVARSVIVAAKLLASALWCLLLSALVFPLWLLVGRSFDLPGWDPNLIAPWFLAYATGNFLLLLLSPATALAASLGKGFLAPIAFILFIIALVQITTIIGYGQYFPWGLPVFALAGEVPEAPTLGLASWVIYGLTVAAGVGGTFAFWRYADQR